MPSREKEGPRKVRSIAVALFFSRVGERRSSSGRCAGASAGETCIVLLDKSLDKWPRHGWMDRRGRWQLQWIIHDTSASGPALAHARTHLPRPSSPSAASATCVRAAYIANRAACRPVGSLIRVAARIHGVISVLFLSGNTARLHYIDGINLPAINDTTVLHFAIIFLQRLMSRIRGKIYFWRDFKSGNIAQVFILDDVCFIIYGFYFYYY